MRHFRPFASFASVLALALSLISGLVLATPAQAAGEAMVLKVSTSYANQTVTLPLYGTVNATVDWGDSTSSSPTTAGQLTHQYATTGSHTVSITGTVTQFGNGGNGYNNANLITDVVTFGDIGLTSLAGAFFGATSLVSLPTTLPAGITDLSNTFNRAYYYNGDISGWDVSAVTTLEYTFFAATTFNQNIGSWNTANVTNMLGTFWNANAFNQDIGSWNTGKVTTMSRMFREAVVFNKSLNSWDVSKVTTFYEMFYVAVKFNGNVAAWDTSSATNMASMFAVDRDFNQNIGSWDTSAVTNFNDMFSGANAFNQDISAWDTSVATNMSGMFYDASYFDQDISIWDTGNVVNMSAMFKYATRFNQEIGTWNVSKVNYFNNTFENASSFNGDLGPWDVSAATTMGCMFCGALVFNQDIGSWVTSSVTTMASMFSSARAFNIDITAWDVSSVTNMENMFSYTWSFNQDISVWDTSKVTNMASMFQAARVFNIALPQVSTPGDWNTGAVVYMQGMFNEAWVFNQDVRSWDTSKVNYMQYMFANNSIFNTALNSVVGGWDTSAVVDMSYMFTNNSVFNQDISSWDTGSVQNLNGTFQNTVVFNQNISTWDVSSVQYMSNTFDNADAFDQPIGAWTTSSVQYLNYTFANNDVFNHSINNWDTADVTQMIGTFQSAKVFNQPLNSWDVGKVVHLSHTFRSTPLFNQPLNNWNTISVQTLESAFQDTTVFNQPLDNWDTSNVNNMYSTFSGAQVFNQNIESWETGNVYYMHYMFAGTPVFNQPLQNWDTSRVNNMQGMFQNAKKFNLPIDTWDTSDVQQMSWMFAGAVDFNQPIMTWDVTTVYYFDHMFYGATNFDMDLSLWTTSNSQSFTNIFVASGVSNAHYSAFLSSRANHTPAYNNYNRIDASAQFLCPAELDRTKLDIDMFWEVYDEGKASCLTSQAVSFTQPEDFGVNKSRILEASSTSELPITFLWISGPCVVEGNKLTATAEGVCVIAAQQKGNGTFDDGIDALRTLTVLPEVPPTVTYDANGGDLGTVPVDANNPYAFNAEITVLGQGTLGLTGEDFLGWTLDSDGEGIVYQPGDKIQLTNQDIVLYAKWSVPPPTHVTYVGTSSESGAVPTDLIDYAIGDTVTVLDGGTLYRYGFEFAGWNTQENGEGTTYQAEDTFSMGTLDVSLYAMWTPLPSYNIIYRGNGSLSGSAPTDTTDYFAEDKITVLGKNSLAWIGYTFIGWNTAEDGSGTAYAVGDEITVVDADFELFAQWTDAPTFTVTYMGNGSDGGNVPVDMNNYLDGDSFTVAAAGSLVRSGYTFIGWNVVAEGTGLSYDALAQAIMNGENVTLHAQWSKDAVTPVTSPSKKLKVLFRPGSSTLSKKAKANIIKFVKAYSLTERANVEISILGFVQPTKATANDKSLSKKRAAAVAKLLKYLGVKAKYTLVAKGKMTYTLAGSRRATIVVNWGLAK